MMDKKFIIVIYLFYHDEFVKVTRHKELVPLNKSIIDLMLKDWSNKMLNWVYVPIKFI